MGVVASLNDQKQSFDSGNDTIVVPLVLETLVNGATLDTTGYTPETIKAGSVVIREDSTGNYKPMPVNGEATAYGTMPANHTYVGVVISTVDSKRPFVGVSIRGNCNEAASPYTVTQAIKTGLPRINFFKN